MEEIVVTIFIRSHITRVLTFISSLFCTSPLLSEHYLLYEQYCRKKNIITRYTHIIYIYINIHIDMYSIHTLRLELLVLQHIWLSLFKYNIYMYGYTHNFTFTHCCRYVIATAAIRILSHIRSP